MDKLSDKSAAAERMETNGCSRMAMPYGFAGVCACELCGGDLLVMEIFLPAMFGGPANIVWRHAAGLRMLSREELAGGYAEPRKTA